MTLTCRAASFDAAEPLAATAPYARGWLVIEVPGAWGRKAVTESGLDSDVAQTLAARAAGTATTILVARRPGRSEGPDPAFRRVWMAHTAPGGVRMRVWEVANDSELLALDPAGIARGESPGVGRRSSDPVLFVCANGKRDQCCAVEGGALARTLAASDDRVWECSHLGGHRFAATALLLPYGTVHGRLDTRSAGDVLNASAHGELPLDTYRGRSAHPRWLQAAEIGVRRAEDIRGIDSLDVLRVVDGRAVPDIAGATSPGTAMITEVRCTDGRAWRVTVESTPWTAARIESCTGEPVSGESWLATVVAPTFPWR